MDVVRYNFGKIVCVFNLLLCFLTPFEVSCFPVLNLVIRILILFSVIIALYYLVLYNNLKITKDLKMFAVCVIVPFILSFIFGTLYIVIFEPNELSFDNIFLDTIGRVSNIIALFALMFLNQQISSMPFMIDEQFGCKVIKYYWWGCFISLFFCIWQFFSFYFGIIPYPFKTRSYIHSVGTLSGLFPGRITGILEEPSYIVPFLFDFIFITYFVGYNSIKKICLVTALICLGATFSGSAGIEIIFLVFFAVFYLFQSFFYKKFNHKGLFILIVLFVAFFTFITLLNNKLNFLDLYTIRIINITASGRFSGVCLPFVEAPKSGFVNLLFGHGPKSYILLHNKFTINITSNSIYADLFWEQGLLGCFGMFIFYYFLYKGVKTSSCYGNLFVVLFIHFMISGLYRSDFASSRYYILLLILIHLRRNSEFNAIHYKLLD